MEAVIKILLNIFNFIEVTESKSEYPCYVTSLKDLKLSADAIRMIVQDCLVLIVIKNDNRLISQKVSLEQDAEEKEGLREYVERFLTG